MNYPEYVNRYCFNPSCNASIFNAPTFSGIKTLLTIALKEEAFCSVCGEEYVSKPVLEMRLLVYESLNSTAAEITA